MSVRQIPLMKWIWDRADSPPTRSASTVLESLQEPDEWSGRFRILSIPRDAASCELQPTIDSYLARHHVPDEFFLERDQSANYMFGNLTDEDNQKTRTWIRLVSKSVQVDRDESGRPRIASPVTSAEGIPDRAWFNFAFVLIEKRIHNTGSQQSTLLCFDAPPLLHKEFNALHLSEPQLKDPYMIFNPVLRVVWKVMDDVTWTLADVFRNIEKGTLQRTARDKRAGSSIDLSELHNISKHQIYLSEAFEAAQIICKDIIESYQARCSATRLPCAHIVEQKFFHSARMFKASHLRLTSLERRIANITSLAFNIVTQEDGRSMHTIALITLVFLPSTLIATVFGSSFFDFSVDDEKSSGVHLSSLFWIFWVISIPITAVVVYLWWNFSPRKKESLSAA